MPSISRKRFDENAADISQLLSTWADAKGGLKSGVTPETSDVLFRSAVVLMVSHWEAYIEDICAEALEHLVKHTADSAKLPKEIKKLIASEIKKAPNEIEMWRLADDGWKQYLKVRLGPLKEVRDRSFNTPKSGATVEFVRQVLGIDDIRMAWKSLKFSSQEASDRLDKFIEVRGQIAHRGRLSEKLSNRFVEDHLSFLQDLVAKTGGHIHKHVRTITGERMWEREDPKIRLSKLIARRRRDRALA